MGRRRREVPWMERRDNGRFYAHWYDTDCRQTRRRSLGTSEPDLAAAAFDDFLFARSHGKHFVPGVSQKTGGMLVIDVVKLYIAGHVEPNCIDVVRSRSISCHLSTFFRTTRIRDIDIPACEAYAAARRVGRVRSSLLHSAVRGACAKDGTIRRELGLLSAAANWAIKRKLIPESEMPTIEAPAEPRGRIVFLSRDELQLAFETAASPLREFIALAYYTGARRRAVEALTPAQVDMKHGLITLESLSASLKERQSKKRKPIIPILRDLRALLERWLPSLQNDEPILPKRNYYMLFKNHLTALHLRTKAFPHVLRHTSATHLLQDGVSVYDVAKLLGDLPTTVERSYAHHSAEYLAKALEGKGLRLF